MDCILFKIDRMTYRQIFLNTSTYYLNTRYANSECYNF